MRIIVLIAATLIADGSRAQEFSQGERANMCDSIIAAHEAMYAGCVSALDRSKGRQAEESQRLIDLEQEVSELRERLVENILETIELEIEMKNIMACFEDHVDQGQQELCLYVKALSYKLKETTEADN